MTAHISPAAVAAAAALLAAPLAAQVDLGAEEQRAAGKVVYDTYCGQCHGDTGDGNGYAHVRAALMKPSLTIPIADGELVLGTWQQVILLDFDNRPRRRTIHVQTLAAA